MIKIKLDDTTIQVPTDWSDIRLGDYEQWFEKQPQTKLDYVRFVADVCNVDDQLLLQSPAELFNVIVSKIEFVFRLQVDPSPSMLVDGVRYCVPIAEKLTLGEWVDIDATLQSDSKTKISEILAIVCRPVGEEYDADNIEQRKELFRNLPCDKALPLLAFFLHRKQQSEKILHLYSTALGQANQFLKATKTFARDGDGIKRLPIWQRIRYTYLIRSLEKQLSKCSDFYSIR